jgi:hypothetical protein
MSRTAGAQPIPPVVRAEKCATDIINALWYYLDSEEIMMSQMLCSSQIFNIPRSKLPRLTPFGFFKELDVQYGVCAFTFAAIL